MVHFLLILFENITATSCGSQSASRKQMSYIKSNKPPLYVGMFKWRHTYKQTQINTLNLGLFFFF